MAELIKYKAIITKTKDLRNSPFASILEGQKFTAFFNDWPKVGNSFWFYEYWIVNGSMISSPVATTEVIEIIDNRTFKTKNSIYSIYTIEDEREDKINNILK